MADINSIADVIERLQVENGIKLDTQSTHLATMETYLADILGTLAPQTDLLEQIAKALAPDAFGSAQGTENDRETGGTPIVAGPPGDSQVQPVDTKKGTSKLAMLGVAAAGAAAGIVAGFAGFLDFDAQKVKDKVLILTSIADEVDGAATAETVTTLGLLGVALAAFGIGSVANGIAQSFMKDKWAYSIVDQVTTLVKIGDLSFGKALKGAANLGTIGVGLAAFGLLSGVGALGQGLANSVQKDGWAQGILDSVTTLVKIGDLSFFKAVEAGASLTTLGAALLAFGVGAGVAKFASGTKWTEDIVANVKTLVKIGDIGFDKVKDFAKNMGLIATGLVAFSVGSGAAGVSGAITKFTGQEDWAGKIKENVKTLMSITSLPGADEASVLQFQNVMKGLATGLVSFSKGKFISGLLDTGSKVLSFLTGSESPVTEMLRIATKADELDKGATALERITSAIEKLGKLKFDGSDLNINDMAEDLLASVPIIEKAIMGGKVKKGMFSWFKDDVELKGLASGDIDYDSATANITALRKSLGMPSPEETVAAAPASGNSMFSNDAQVTNTADGIRGSIMVEKKNPGFQQAQNLSLASSQGAGGPGVVAPTAIVNTTNNQNATNTSIATRNEHHKRDLTSLTNVDF